MTGLPFKVHSRIFAMERWKNEDDTGIFIPNPRAANKYLSIYRLPVSLFNRTVLGTVVVNGDS